MSLFSIQRPGVWKMLLWLTLIFLVLLFLDYRYHERMIATSFRNYVWLGYYRYGPTADFKYSVDVIIGAWLYILIIAYGMWRRKLNSAVLVAFPILMIVIRKRSIIRCVDKIQPPK
jgi:uncharacterized membrane protein